MRRLQLHPGRKSFRLVRIDTLAFCAAQGNDLRDENKRNALRRNIQLAIGNDQQIDVAIRYDAGTVGESDHFRAACADILHQLALVACAVRRKHGNDKRILVYRNHRTVTYVKQMMRVRLRLRDFRQRDGAFRGKALQLAVREHHGVAPFEVRRFANGGFYACHVSFALRDRLGDIPDQLLVVADECGDKQVGDVKFVTVLVWHTLWSNAHGSSSDRSALTDSGEPVTQDSASTGICCFS